MITPVKLYVIIPAICYVSLIQLPQAKRLLALVLMSTWLSLLLKSIYQVPLNPALGTHTWALPSGHLLLVALFWPYFFYSLKFSSRQVVLLSIGCVIWEGWYLYASGYHSLNDMVASVLFAIPSLILFHSYWKENRIRHNWMMHWNICLYLLLPKVFPLLLFIAAVHFGIAFCYGFSLKRVINLEMEMTISLIFWLFVFWLRGFDLYQLLYVYIGGHLIALLLYGWSFIAAWIRLAFFAKSKRI